MPRRPDNHLKIKMLRLMEILRQETDENHPMKTSEVTARLGDFNIICDRRTVRDDVDLLIAEGYAVEQRMIGHEKAYYVADRSFSVPELRVLVDAVEASTFIPAGKSAELIQKIAALGGSHEAEVLSDRRICFNSTKHTNESIFYNVSMIQQALDEKKKLSFFYFDLNEKREKVYRKEKKRYCENPVSLVLNGDNYYLLAYSDKHKKLLSYRVDRMDSVNVEPDAVSAAAGSYDSRLGSLTKEMFRMFAGKEKNVTLRFPPSLFGPVYDKFGEDTVLHPSTDGLYTATVRVQVSPVFFGWVFQFGGEMEIVSPKGVVEEYEERLSKVLEC